MKVLLISLATSILLGCASNKVQLFERDSYYMTRDGDKIVRSNEVFEAKTGIWLSKEAIEKLQKSEVLP